MKNLIVLETIEELLHAANRVRHESDTSPVLPADATLVFEHGFEFVRLEAEGFQMARMKSDPLIAALVERAGLKANIT